MTKYYGLYRTTEPSAWVTMFDPVDAPVVPRSDIQREPIEPPVTGQTQNPREAIEKETLPVPTPEDKPRNMRCSVCGKLVFNVLHGRQAMHVSCAFKVGR